jgi:hypothetical protein
MRPRHSDHTLQRRTDPRFGLVVAMVTSAADSGARSLRLAGMSRRQDTPWPSLAIPRKRE